jgi:hypothetical protein
MGHDRVELKVLHGEVSRERKNKGGSRGDHPTARTAFGGITRDWLTKNPGPNPSQNVQGNLENYRIDQEDPVA